MQRDSRNPHHWERRGPKQPKQSSQAAPAGERGQSMFQSQTYVILSWKEGLVCPAAVQGQPLGQGHLGTLKGSFMPTAPIETG